MTSLLFFDTDCISSFLWVRREDILVNLYQNRIVLPKQVFEELSHPSIPHISSMIRSLVSNGDVTTQEIYIDTEEFKLYCDLAVTPCRGETIIGKGEAAAIALAKATNGILASNNYKDVYRYVQKYSLMHHTTGDILEASLHGGLIDEATGNHIWNDMLAKKRCLPTATFSEFLSGGK